MLCGEDGSLGWVTRAGPRDKALGMERADSARTQRNEAHDRVLAEHSNPCAPANHHPEPPPINFHIAPVISSVWSMATLRFGSTNALDSSKRMMACSSGA